MAEYDTKAVANLNLLKNDIAIRISEAVTKNAALFRFYKSGENPNYTKKAFFDFFEAFFALFQETKHMLKAKDKRIVVEINEVFEDALENLTPEILFSTFDKYSRALRDSGIWDTRYFNISAGSSWRESV